MKGPPALGPIVGESVAVRRARDLIEQYAPTTLPILLVGATGTGKELLARHIHARSGRSGRCVAVNCGAMPYDMAEGLLFGYERGAFSGAIKQHRGHFECADGGTLFLDELLSLSLDGQAKLLRALDTGEIQRLGEEVERYVDLRVVAAVQEDVLGRMDRGALRRDLYRRVAGVVIELPPLAERPEDVIPLARHFAAQRGQELEPGTLEVLGAYSWPGNVREMRHVIDRAGCAVANGTVPAAAVRGAIALGAPPGAEGGSRLQGAILGAFTRQGVVALCEMHGWNTQRIADALRMGRTAFFAELRAAGLTMRGLRKFAAFTNVRVLGERSAAYRPRADS